MFLDHLSLRQYVIKLSETQCKPMLKFAHKIDFVYSLDTYKSALNKPHLTMLKINLLYRQNNLCFSAPIMLKIMSG